MTATAEPARAVAVRPVVIVGGGLAGLAAAAALVDRGCITAGRSVRILEFRRKVGGRAASFEDPASGGLVDACQHVALGCCTNFLDLCRRTGLDERFRRDRTLWFIGPDGRRAACTPSSWLPAPLHLTPLLGTMGHFSLREKANLALGLLRLARCRGQNIEHETTTAWLARMGQQPRVVDLFWRPVVESAVGESIEFVSLSATRKVIVDGFLAHPHALDLMVPLEPLGRIFGEGLAGWLEARGVSVETGVAVEEIIHEPARGIAVRIARPGTPHTETVECDGCILAVPWRQAAKLVPEAVPDCDEKLAGSPITAVHLWFDRPVIDLPHAVLVGRVSQWVFGWPDEGYCQVVISASRNLASMERQAVVERVVAELREVFPAAREATVVNARVVTDPTAVLSVRPGVDAVRPKPVSAIEGLFLAGDWTATGWPSTMEGAVRSGRIAADAWLRSHGLPHGSVVPDLPKNPVIRLLVGAASPEVSLEVQQR